MPTEHGIRVTGEWAFFAASNSRNGFCSYYESCFRARVARLFCIKGGPGTGKSYLMRQIGMEAQERGYSAEYWYCSSDADSLDGVLLFGKTPEDSFGLVDATAPHTLEPAFPGVSEEILDLGVFWDSGRLRAHADEILRLNERKAAGYRSAYRYLSAAGELYDEMRDRVAPCMEMPRLCRLAQRLMRGVEASPGAQIRYGLMDSIGMRGRVRLGTFLRARRVCLIENVYDSAYFLTAELYRLAKERGVDSVVSCHPVVPDRVDALWFPACDTAFVVCEATQRPHCERVLREEVICRVVPMRRLMRREELLPVREMLRQTARQRESMLEGSVHAFGEVSAAHFTLEKVYTDAMDFSAKQAFTAELCRRLFSS